MDAVIGQRPQPGSPGSGGLDRRQGLIPPFDQIDFQRRQRDRLIVPHQRSRTAFGVSGISQPPLDAGDALALGFRGDAIPPALVSAVLARIEREGLADPDSIP